MPWVWAVSAWYLLPAPQSRADVRRGFWRLYCLEWTYIITAAFQSRPGSDGVDNLNANWQWHWSCRVKPATKEQMCSVSLGARVSTLAADQRWRWGTEQHGVKLTPAQSNDHCLLCFIRTRYTPKAHALPPPHASLHVLRSAGLSR